jgi:hypothetical protein
MSNNLCYIQPKNSLKKRDKQQKIINAIKEKVQSLHNHESLRNGQSIDPELILMICNCVENVIKKKAGLNKKEFVIEVLKSIFGNLTDNEIAHVDTQCQYNFDNGLIEKIPILYKTGSILYNYIKSKL